MYRSIGRSDQPRRIAGRRGAVRGVPSDSSLRTCGPLRPCWNRAGRLRARRVWWRPRFMRRAGARHMGPFASLWRTLGSFRTAILTIYCRFTAQWERRWRLSLLSSSSGPGNARVGRLFRAAPRRTRNHAARHPWLKPANESDLKIECRHSREC